MYPKLPDLINDLLGTHWNAPVQTYGFFMALAFVFAGFLLFLELRRKERNGVIAAREKTRWEGKPASFYELALTAVILFMVGFKVGGIIMEYGEFSRNPQDYIASGQGSWWLGLLLAIAGAYYQYYSKN